LQYYKTKELKYKLKKGTYLVFTRESKDPHDSFATMINDLDKKSWV